MERYFVRYSAWFNTGPLLFNTFLCDQFLIIDSIDFASYADDNTPYITNESTEKVISLK